MNGKTIQIKTVEKLIIQELYNSESSDHRVHTAFARARPFFRRRLSAQDRSSADYHDHLHQSLLQIQKDESAQSGIIHRHQNAPELQKIVRKALCKILSQSRRRTRGHAAPSARRTPQKNCQLEKGTL